MSVIRWEIQSSFGDDACMAPARDGEYVSLKDYLALRALVEVAYNEGRGEVEEYAGWLSSISRQSLEAL